MTSFTRCLGLLLVSFTVPAMASLSHATEQPSQPAAVILNPSATRPFTNDPTGKDNGEDPYRIR